MKPVFDLSVYEVGAIVICLIVIGYGFSVRRVSSKGVVTAGKVLAATATFGLIVAVFGWGVVRTGVRLVGDFFMAMF